jgi:hypothetical protein
LAAGSDLPSADRAESGQGLPNTAYFWGPGKKPANPENGRSLWGPVWSLIKAFGGPAPALGLIGLDKFSNWEKSVEIGN